MRSFLFWPQLNDLINECSCTIGMWTSAGSLKERQKAHKLCNDNNTLDVSNRGERFVATQSFKNKCDSKSLDSNRNPKNIQVAWVPLWSILFWSGSFLKSFGGSNLNCQLRFESQRIKLARSEIRLSRFETCKKNSSNSNKEGYQDQQ